MSRTRTLNRKPNPSEQITLEFSENALLPALAGAHSRNFVRLEQQCGVRIATRGYHDSDRREIAAADQRLNLDIGLEPGFHLSRPRRVQSRDRRSSPPSPASR